MATLGLVEVTTGGPRIESEPLQALEKAQVEAHENRDKWFYASVPEDASMVGIRHPL